MTAEDEPHQVAVVVEGGEGESVAEVEAAAAAASAQHAREAAQLAVVEAEAATADVAALAADELSTYQARLMECEASLSATRSQVESSETRMLAIEAQNAELMEHLSSIRSRLEASPEPEPQSPPEEPPSEARETGDHESRAEEPSPPERKRAHRWI